MKNKMIPISLSQLFLSDRMPFAKTFRRVLVNMEFDYRHDFIFTDPNTTLSIVAFFANEKLRRFNDAKGICRPVSFSLVDKSVGRAIASDNLTVSLRYGQAGTAVQSCLNLNNDLIDVSHNYAVEVRDTKTLVLLGTQELHFFSPFYGENDATDYFKPQWGAVISPDHDIALKAFSADDLTYYSAIFCVATADRDVAPTFIPEMEVRIHYSDGSMDNFFIQPESIDNDASIPMYQIKAPFLMTGRKRGIGYAELVVFDYAIAGFVFNSDSDEEISGTWVGPNLYILEDYTLDAATDRFRESIENEGPTDPDCSESEGSNDDPFEQMLQEFISSQMSEEQPFDRELNTLAQESDTEAKRMNVETREAVEHNISFMSSLRHLTGLKSVKEQLASYEKLMTFNRMRTDNGFPTLSLPLHAMFLGSPGTGKTTVAKRMGLMLRRVGALSKGHVVIRERATLLGRNYSDEQTNTLQAIEEAQGGILFIDEAYQLYQPHDPRDPGKFVIEALLTALADTSKRDWMLILAGYTDEMKRMFEMNPGLKSRIPESNIYIFDDFSENELMEIAEQYLERNSYSLSPDARKTLALRLGDDYRHRDRSFGNARHVINLIQTEILPSMASRVVELGNPDCTALSVIKSCDIPQARNLIQSGHHKIGY